MGDENLEQEVCEECGERHLTPHNKPSCPSHITSGVRKGQPCKNDRGKGTTHVGIGQCRKHGGNTESANIHARREKVRNELTQLGVTEWEAVQDPYTLLANIAGKIAMTEERLHEKVEELNSLRQYGGEMGDRIDIIYEAWERAIDRVVKVGTSMARLDLDARIAKLQAAIDAETARIVQRALDGALKSEGLPEAQRTSIMRVFGQQLRVREEPKALEG